LLVFDRRFVGFTTDLRGLRRRLSLTVFLMERRQSARQKLEALKTAEIAYNTATKPHVPPSFLSEVVKVGFSIAKVSGDENAISQWSLRSPQQK